MPYIGKTPSFGVRNRFVFTPDAGATSVSGADANGSTLTFTDGAFVDVYLNGVLLKPTTDYNTNTANTIAGLTATVANDEVTVIVYDVFAVGDTVSAVNGGTFSGAVTVTTDGNTEQLKLVSTDADANEGPLAIFHRNSSSPADGDSLGRIYFSGENDAGEEIQYVRFQSILDDASDGTEDSSFRIQTYVGGAVKSKLFTSSAETVFNDDSADVDFRVESNGNTHMLFVDGGNNGVGIGTSSADTNATMTVSNTGDNHAISIVGALNKSRMHFQGANTGSASTDGLVIGLSSSDDTNDDSALIGLKESGSLTLQTNNTNHLIIDGNGHVTMPKQPAFSVTSNQMNNIAINNTTTIQFANEIFDQNADFNHSNYTFTAPVTGKYMLNVNLRMDNVDIAHMYMYMILATSNREYEWLLDISEYQNDLDYLPFTINVLADMDASDTALVKMHIPNAGAAQSDVVGSNKTTFSGFLAC